MKLRIAIAVMVAPLMLGMTPASAHSGAFYVGGPMSTSPTWALVGACVAGGLPGVGQLCPSPVIGWSLDGMIGVGVHNTTPETISIGGGGTAGGYCGAATGTGNVRFVGVTTETFPVTFDWLGTTIVIQGDGDRHSLYMVFKAVPTTGDCFTSGVSRCMSEGYAQLL